MKSLIPILLALPFLSGCGLVSDMADAQLTPEQVARLDTLESRNTALEVAMDATRLEALEAIKAADVSRGEVVMLKLRNLLDEQKTGSDEAQAIIDSSPTKLSGIMKFAGSIPGPWQAFIPFAGTILTTMLGRRSRKWAWISVKNVASVGLIDTLKNLGRTVGMVHSSESSEAAAIADDSSPLTA